MGVISTSCPHSESEVLNDLHRDELWRGRTERYFAKHIIQLGDNCCGGGDIAELDTEQDTLYEIKQSFSASRGYKKHGGCPVSVGHLYGYGSTA